MARAGNNLRKLDSIEDEQNLYMGKFLQPLQGLGVEAIGKSNH